MANINMNVGVTTTKEGSVYVQIQTSSVSIPFKVFAIEALPKSKDNLAPQYRLSHVCSVQEIADLPEDEPGEESSYFRVCDISMLFDTAEMAADAIRIITEDVSALDKEYTTLYALITGGTATPDPGPDNPGIIPNVYYEDL